MQPPLEWAFTLFALIVSDPFDSPIRFSLTAVITNFIFMPENLRLILPVLNVTKIKTNFNRALHQTVELCSSTYSQCKVSSFQARYLLSYLNGWCRSYMRSIKGYLIWLIFGSLYSMHAVHIGCETLRQRTCIFFIDCVVGNEKGKSN